MGYRNVKTNTFSGRLSSARQFQLIVLNDQNYSLTELALRIIHPIDPGEVSQLLRQACLAPHLYAELIRHYAGKRLPEAEILGNLMMHKYQITASAKSSAADAFLDSLRFVGMMNDQRLVESISGADSGFSLAESRVAGSVATASSAPAASVNEPVAKAAIAQMPTARRSEIARPKPENEVRLDLTLWDSDQGKRIRLRAPSTVTRSSMARFLEALRLAVRVVDDPATPATEERSAADAWDEDTD